MSKELIEKLREKADSLTTTVGVMTLLHEAADALEAKAAPVGEREAFDVWLKSNWSEGLAFAHAWARAGFHAGAAYQRQRGVVVSADWLKQVHRDLDACQKLIWANLRGCDPAYCADAQARLSEIDELIARLNGAGSHE